jgi:hypothetical protein
VLACQEKKDQSRHEVKTKEVGGAEITIELKNFGRIPAFQFSADWSLVIKGKATTPEKSTGPEQTFTLYPHANQGMKIFLKPST